MRILRPSPATSSRRTLWTAWKILSIPKTRSTASRTTARIILEWQAGRRLLGAALSLVIPTIYAQFRLHRVRPRRPLDVAGFAHFAAHRWACAFLQFDPGPSFSLSRSVGSTALIP